MEISKSFVYFSYHGNSMRGTFREGDLLLVRSINFASICPGDVITFKSSRCVKLIAHRVRAVFNGSLLTRGDALQFSDREIVTPDMFLGRVEYVERNNKLYSVLGGWNGHLWAQSLRLSRYFKNILGNPYRALRASGLFQRLAIPFVSQVVLATPEGSRIKYLFLGRSVATWQPAQGRFICRKPFDLFIKPPG